MPVTTQVTTQRPNQITADALIVPVGPKGELPGALPKSVTSSLSKHLKEIGGLKSWGSATVFSTIAGSRQPHVGVVAVNPEHSLNKRAEGMRRSLGLLAQQLRSNRVKSAVLVLTEQPDAPTLAAAAAEATTLASYRYTEFSKKGQKSQRDQALRKLQIVVSDDDLAATRLSLLTARHLLAGVELTRELVNQPASRITPTTLVDEATRLATTNQNITLRVLDRQQAERDGFTAFLAVARGSQEEPYVIHLTYQPTNAAPETKKIALVGKGITFDSGGLSLKPAEAMEDMKIDMAGAASVLGTFTALAKIKPNVEVHGIIATCENMPSGTAYRPGDILTTKNGTTIEVLNTDAEGRITLADALCYAVEQKPDAIIDLATLTGAAMAALGETHAALMSNNSKLAAEIRQAAARTGEGMAVLPLPAEYEPQIESTVADIRNISTSRYGGAITAGLFLKHFVGTTPWAHLDIAGPSYLSSSILPYYTKGATGYGVRTLLTYLQFESEKVKN